MSLKIDEEREIFREKIPWLDESLSLVGIRKNEIINLMIVRTTNGVETKIQDVCEFKNGKMSFNIKERLSYYYSQYSTQNNTFTNITSTEKLCLSILPHGYNPTKIPEILKNPVWQHIIDYMKVEYVMTS